MRTIHFFILFLCIACNDAAKPKTEAASQTDEKTACLLSQISYCENEQQALDKHLPGWRVVWESTELGGNHAIVTTNGDAYALAIRGSLMEFSWAAVQNWIYQDLNIVSLQKWSYTHDSSKAKIAQGAWDGWNNLIKMTDRSSGATLISFLEKNIKTHTPLLITGHSLGGNLATVYGSWLWQYFHDKGEPRDNINVITFAAPAAGNKAFARDFDHKFPQALRFENTNDIVPKFPCTSRVSALGDLYDASASNVMVGYKDLTIPLSQVFSLINMALVALEFSNSNAEYTQPCGEGKLVAVKLTGKNKLNDIGGWLSEAGYHHGIASYASYLDVPVIACDIQ
jgi:triacylglycerol lipase